MLLDKINIALIVVGSLSLFLGLLVFFNGTKKRVNKVYTWNIIAIVSWIMAMFFYRSSGQQYNVLWCTILYINPTLVASSFLYFTYIFPSQKERVLWWRGLIIFGINLILVVMIAVPGLIIKEVNIRPGLEKEIIFSRFYILYFLYTLLFFSYGFTRLFIKYLKAEKVEKAQISYLLFGYALAANLAFATNLIMPWIGYFFLNWLGQICTIFMVASTAYAIVAHRLMDIKLVMRQSFVFFSSVLAISIPAGIILYYSDQFLPDYNIITNLAVLILSVSVFSPIRNYYYRIANKYFFSSLYDTREVITKLSDGLRSTLDVTEVYNFISHTLIGTFHTKAVGVLNYDATSAQYVVQFNSGFLLGDRKIFPGDKILQEEYIKKSKVIVVEEIKSAAYEQHKEMIDMLMGLGAAVIVPLNIKDETLGVMVLGNKESGDMYNDEDLRTLETIASQAAISIKNAQLYNETRGFSVTLQKEVERQTAQLKEANIELQKLDKAKSDFISIASHQLRTPLTAIKGFTSMILEGSYGRVTNVVRDKLEKVFESAERLIRLVNDLLDLSHMEGGGMEYNFAKVDFDAMVRSVVEELTPPAEKKKLKFKWRTPDENIWVWADEQKLRQVVMNLIDNAIKYTPQGAVDVVLERVDGSVQMSVKDTGMGMKPGELENLFQKFVRGAEAPRYHTEGAGIGLYVAKQLIEAQKGQIWAVSAGEDKGATFFVKMPECQQ